MWSGNNAKAADDTITYKRWLMAVDSYATTNPSWMLLEDISISLTDMKVCWYLQCTKGSKHLQTWEKS